MVSIWNSVAFDKDADRLVLATGINLYLVKAKLEQERKFIYTNYNLASATYIGTIGNGYTGSKDLDLEAHWCGDKFGEGIDKETGNRLVRRNDGRWNNNSKSISWSYAH